MAGAADVTGSKENEIVDSVPMADEVLNVGKYVGTVSWAIEVPSPGSVVRPSIGATAGELVICLSLIVAELRHVPVLPLNSVANVVNCWTWICETEIF